MISHQSAVEQVQEPDIAQASDPVVQYLKDVGFHLRLAPGMSKQEIRAEIMRTIRQAEIGEDPGALGGILARTNVPVALGDKTLSKIMFLDALAPALKENEERYAAQLVYAGGQSHLVGSEEARSTRRVGPAHQAPAANRQVRRPQQADAATAEKGCEERRAGNKRV